MGQFAQTTKSIGKNHLLLCLAAMFSLMALACGESTSQSPCDDGEIETANKGCLASCENNSECGGTETCKEVGLSSKVCWPSGGNSTGNSSGDGGSTGNTTADGGSGSGTTTADGGSGSGTTTSDGGSGSGSGSGTTTGDGGTTTTGGDTGTSSGQDTGTSTTGGDAGGSAYPNPTRDLNCSELLTCFNFCPQGDQNCSRQVQSGATQMAIQQYSALGMCYQNNCSSSSSNNCLEMNCKSELDACTNQETDTPYNCAELTTCLSDCGMDEQCQQTCATNATSMAQSQYQAIGTCAQNKCANATDQVACYYDKCDSELAACNGCPMQ